MPARKWKTDETTDPPKPLRRYWLTLDANGGPIVASAKWTGLRWEDLCGADSIDERDLHEHVVAWMSQPDTPEPCEPRTPADPA